MSVVRIADSPGIPWRTILPGAVSVAIIVGPVAWYLRSRYGAERRERLGLVAFGVAMLLLPIWLGVALAFEIPLVTSFHGLIVGGLVGTAVVWIAERTVVPDRLRGMRA